jgi:hypothetical protein
LNQSSSALREIRMDSPPTSAADPSSYPVRFRFPVTWSYVTAVPAAIVLARAAVAPKSAAAPAEPARPDGTWEMVIPKMARPLRIAAPAPLRSSISFCSLQSSALPRRWKAVAAGISALLVAGVIAWVRPGSASSEPAVQTVDSGAGWSRRTAYLLGSRDPREIVVYEGSTGLDNYRIEFAWLPNSGPLGLIFRGQDSSNYYGAQLAVVQPGPNPTLAAEHFTVYQGREGPHSRKAVSLTNGSGAVSVRLDAAGPIFTLYLQGNPADSWTDARFPSGSLGFFEDRGQRPFVQGLRFTFLKKGGPQTVITSFQ